MLDKLEELKMLEKHKKLIIKQSRVLEPLKH